MKKNLVPLLKKGFSFIEIMLAVAIFGLIATSVLGLLNSSLTYAARSHAVVATMLKVKNLFADPENFLAFQKDPKKIIEKKIKEPEATLTMRAEGFKNKNLEEKFKNCYVVKAVADWHFLNQQREEMMIGIGFIQKIEEEKKEK